MDVVYDKKEEQPFDEMVATLKTMSEQEQQHFVTVFQSIIIGIRLGREERKNEKERPA